MSAASSLLAAVLWLFDANRDIVGNVAFALMAAAVFTTVAICSGAFASDSERHATRIVWILVASAVLIFSLAINAQAPGAEVAGIVLYLSMIAMAAPASLLLVVFGPALTHLLTAISIPVLQPLVVWAAFAVLGALQWFYLVPLAGRVFTGGVRR